MLTRRKLIAALALLLPCAVELHGGQDQPRPAESTTVTLMIEGMT